MSKSVQPPSDAVQSARQVVRELETQFPDDWCACISAKALLMYMVCVGIMVGVAFRLPLLNILVICACLSLVTFVAPVFIWSRIPGFPRWAHSAVIISSEQSLLLQKICRSRPRFSIPITGLDLFLLLLTVPGALEKPQK